MVPAIMNNTLDSIHLFEIKKVSLGFLVYVLLGVGCFYKTLTPNCPKWLRVGLATLVLQAGMRLFVIFGTHVVCFLE